jgi:hypothetical protein
MPGSLQRPVEDDVSSACFRENHQLVVTVLATASTSTSVAFDASEATPMPVMAVRELLRNLEQFK